MESRLPFIMRLVASSVSCSTRASAIVRQVMQSGNMETVDKGIRDFQTKADRDSQKCIVYSLAHHFPKLKVIGEEGSLDSDASTEVCKEMDEKILAMSCPEDLVSVKEEDTTVWIDPMDGTQEFTEGLLHHVTVLLGIAVKGVPVGGVICQPFHSDKHFEENAKLTVEETKTRLIWGLKGLGLFGLNENLPSLPAFEFSKNNIIVTTRSHMTDAIANAIKACEPSKVVQVGGCGYKVIQLMEGLAHSYVFASGGCKKWDTCAPEAILGIAGGKLTDLFGQPYQYGAEVRHANSRGVLATAQAAWHEKIVAKIPEQMSTILKDP